MDGENERRQAEMIAELRRKREEPPTSPYTEHPSGASHRGSRTTTRTPPPAHTNARPMERSPYRQEGAYRRPQPEQYGGYDDFVDEDEYVDEDYYEDDDIEVQLRMHREEMRRLTLIKDRRNRIPPSNTYSRPAFNRQQPQFGDPRAQYDHWNRAPFTPQGPISQADQIEYLQEQLRQKREADKVNKNEELIRQLTDQLLGTPAPAPPPLQQAYYPYPSPAPVTVPPYVPPYGSHAQPYAPPLPRYEAPVSLLPMDHTVPQARPAVATTASAELETLKKVVEDLKRRAANPVVSGPSTESLARHNESRAERDRLQAELDATSSVSSLRATIESKTKANAQIQYGIDICFLLDCTGSMGSFIKAAKDKISEIIDNVKSIEAKAIVKVAFVGYRDYGDAVKLETVDFIGTSELSSFKAHLSKCQATGGGDGPEDIAGGLAATSRLSWSSSTRLVIHFADWPCHGTKYHDQGGDSYPSGDPEGLVPETFLTMLASEKRVDFYFMEISSITRKMTNIFQRTYAAAGRQFFVNPISASADEFVPKVVKSITSSMARSEAFGPKKYDLEY